MSQSIFGKKHPSETIEQKQWKKNVLRNYLNASCVLVSRPPTKKREENEERTTIVESNDDQSTCEYLRMLLHTSFD